MLEARIQQQFFDTADLVNQSAEALARSTAAAAQALVAALTAGSKVLCMGLGEAHLEAERLANGLITGHERSRPGLAAIALRALPTEPAAEGLARQVQALGQSGDVLALFTFDDLPDVLLDAVRERDMTLVAIVAGPADNWSGPWLETDVVVHVPALRVSAAAEWQVRIVYALLDAIDVQLLGESLP